MLTRIGFKECEWRKAMINNSGAKSILYSMPKLIIGTQVEN